MRVRWFGVAWPSEKLRAPICEEAYRIDTPIGAPCITCTRPIMGGERGVLMAAYKDMPDGFWLDFPEAPGGEVFRWFVCAEHIDCHLATVLGPELARKYAPKRVP